MKQTLAHVTSGNADAGLVYATDVAAAKNRARGIRFPQAQQAITHYSITVVNNTRQATLAHKFQNLITGELGTKTLQAAGFGTNHE